MTPTPIKAGSHRATNDKAFELITARLESGSRILDLGAGRGHLARRIGSWLEARGEGGLLAADISQEGFEATEVPFRRLNFNEPLPFDDQCFDVIYTIEVMEHLHRPYDLLKECFRVLKPGGWLIASTPNILNLQSRFRFLFTGFWDLYQPPSIDPANGGRICGHVMPLHLAYYAYGLRYDPTVYAENREVLAMVNGQQMMTARSLIFAARRPALSQPG